MKKDNKKPTFDSTVGKLIVLFAAEQIEFPATEETLLEICASANEWLEYFVCKAAVKELTDTGLLCNVGNNKKLYAITADGAVCLGHFFHCIPLSLREEIGAYIKENRQKYKRKQEYTGDYYKNLDGTYTLILKINDSVNTIFELRLVVQNRHDAKWIYKNWVDKAPSVYSSVYEILHE
ncbi:MAG: DUF4364 family protein [Clostridiales bacterium]|jgi:hypothetical protein|nr:DUF4364 family protein [Clostridiales bacterium]